MHPYSNYLSSTGSRGQLENYKGEIHGVFLSHYRHGKYSETQQEMKISTESPEMNKLEEQPGKSLGQEPVSFLEQILVADPLSPSWRY